MDLMSGMTLGIALVGAFLGVLNTWRSFDRDRPKLRVTPVHAIPVGGYERAYSGISFGIEVINLSPFPITVRELGFMHRGLNDRAVVVEPVTIDSKGLPRRLEPREAVSFYMETPRPRGAPAALRLCEHCLRSDLYRQKWRARANERLRHRHLYAAASSRGRKRPTPLSPSARAGRYGRRPAAEGGAGN